MPDICMGRREECPKAKTCYRITATPSYYQSYSSFESSCNKESEYQYYIKMEKKKAR